jgi:uncharacterized protein involved in exopolysaccharide biosynthesis
MALPRDSEGRKEVDNETAPSSEDPAGDMTETIELRPFGAILRRRWPIIFLLVALFTGFGLAYAFLWPPVWQADAILIPDLRQEEAAAGGLAALVSPNAATPLSIMKGALDSKSAVDALMKATGLERIKAQTYLDVVPDEHTDELVISAKDTDKQRAYNAVASAIDSLQNIYSRTNKTSAARQAAFIQTEIVKQQARLKAAEQKVADFASHLDILADPTAASSEFYLGELQKQEFQLYALNKQLADIKSHASHVGSQAGKLPTGLPGLDDWRARVIDLQYQYEALRRNTGDQNPEVLRLKQQLDVANETLETEKNKYIQSVEGSVDKDIAQMEVERDQAQAAVDYLQKRVREVPKVSLQLKRLAEEAEVSQKVVDTLREKYEEAKVEAEVAQVKFAVLDPPYVEDLPVNHRPLRYAGLGAAVGAVVSVFVVIWWDRRRNHGEDGDSPVGGPIRNAL